jgi:hypothetical protein
LLAAGVEDVTKVVAVAQAVIVLALAFLSQQVLNTPLLLGLEVLVLRLPHQAVMAPTLFLALLTLTAAVAGAVVFQALAGPAVRAAVVLVELLEVTELRGKGLMALLD